MNSENSQSHFGSISLVIPDNQSNNQITQEVERFTMPCCGLVVWRRYAYWSGVVESSHWADRMNYICPNCYQKRRQFSSHPGQEPKNVD